MSLLAVNNLSHSFQDGESIRVILDNVSFEFEKSKTYAILGYSGSGKTTLLSLLAGLDKPNSGSIEFDSKTITPKNVVNYRRNNIAIVFQQFNLIGYLTALENILLSMNITENDIPENQKKVAYNLLKYVGIVETKADRHVKKLSGGEQQRVAIARALSTNVDLVFADEPTGNLDSETENEIISIFNKLAHEHNKCIILVTHSNEVANKADVILRLNKGSLTVVESLEQ